MVEHLRRIRLDELNTVRVTDKRTGVILEMPMCMLDGLGNYFPDPAVRKALAALKNAAYELESGMGPVEITFSLKEGE